MKKSIKHLISIVAAAALMLPVSCDKTYVEEVVVSAPRIDSFEPMSAPVGSEIVVTGAFLNDVVTATIGGVEVTILERVSSSRLSILASGEAKSGVISLTNAAGVGESAEAFTYSYAAPEITTSILQPSVDMGDQMLIAGKYMGAAEAVIFTAEGYTEGHEAQIITQSASELVVKCPYVEESQARITLRYFNGTTSVETSLETAPVIEVMRYKPQFDTPTFVRTDVGRSVKLTGSYLDKVDKILVGGFEAQCFKSHSELSFTVPAGDFGDGETTTDVKAVYFDGNEETILSEAFVVYVPFVKFWENMRTWGQGRDVEALSSFFSPETGQVYANSDWREKVDPISYQYQALTCSANQTPNKEVITEEQYLSVNPYFFFSGITAGQLQVNSPANSKSQLTNFYMINNSADEHRVTGVKGDCYGTPVLTFRHLSEANADEKELIDAVRNKTLEKIDEETFPIDEVNKTVGKISISSAKGTVNSDVWAPGIFTVGQPQANAQIDAVLMVLYYGYEGSVENVAANVRRIGFLHIRTVNFVLYNNTDAPSSSDILFNMYWQKYDYDHSKIQ